MIAKKPLCKTCHVELSQFFYFLKAHQRVKISHEFFSFPDRSSAKSVETIWASYRRIPSSSLLTRQGASIRMVDIRMVVVRMVAVWMVDIRMVDVRMVDIRMVVVRMVALRIVAVRMVALRIVAVRMVAVRMVAFRMHGCCQEGSVRKVAVRMVSGWLLLGQWVFGGLRQEGLAILVCLGALVLRRLLFGWLVSGKLGGNCEEYCQDVAVRNSCRQDNCCQGDYFHDSSRMLF